MRIGNGAIGADNGLYAKACGQRAVTPSVLRRRDEVGGRALVTARFVGKCNQSTEGVYGLSCSAATSLRLLRVDDVTILGASHAGGMRSLLTPAIVQGTARDPRGPWPPD